MHKVIRMILETKFHRSQVSKAWCMNSGVLVLTSVVMVNQTHNTTSITASLENRRLKFRSKTSMPSIVGIATAVAHGKASNAVHVNECGFRNATMTHRTTP